jgi:hypothetical protein
MTYTLSLGEISKAGSGLEFSTATNTSATAASMDAASNWLMRWKPFLVFDHDQRHSGGFHCAQEIQFLIQMLNSSFTLSL